MPSGMWLASTACWATTNAKTKMEIMNTWNAPNHTNKTTLKHMHKTRTEHTLGTDIPLTQEKAPKRTV